MTTKRVDEYDTATPADADQLIGIDASDTTDAAAGTVKRFTFSSVLTYLANTFATLTQLSTHESDTTSVHGITDTSALYKSGGTDVALADGGTGASLDDPGADRLMFWDDSAGSVAFLTAGTGLSISGTTITASGGSAPDFIHIVDSKSSGTNGGTFTSGAWQTRTLNTEKSDSGNHASLASNQITLDAGDYVCYIVVPAFACNRHAARLYNATDSAVLLNSTVTHNSSPNTVGGHVVIQGKFTIGASKAIEVQHQCETTRSTDGFGIAAGAVFTVAEEIYTNAAFWKVG